tara:strand:+ start:4449 stop:5300 length:852 start_codon:yes stop_codon:yes gene_type:complete
MASAADVVFAQLQQDEANRLNEQIRKQQQSLQRRRGKMGIGRMLGGVAGGLLGLALAPVTGGASLAAAIGAGIGSRVGSEAGTRGAFGNASISQVEVGKLNQEQARQARSAGVQAERDLNRSANVNMLSDAFSAYTLAGTRFGQGAQRFAKNPVQFTQNMFGQAQAPAGVIPNTMAMPNINLNNNQRLDFLNTAARNNAYLSPTNIAQARGMTGPSNFVQQVGGNINTLSTPINSTVASTTNAYQRYLDNPIIQQTGIEFNPNQPMQLEDLFAQNSPLYGGNN